ncbi:hypothetical protein KC321_g14 [Hortaea werneckii]|nr:hypothetical protein KC321_g14 [Hortaea werneckii]
MSSRLCLSEEVRWRVGVLAVSQQRGPAQQASHWADLQELGCPRAEYMPWLVVLAAPLLQGAEQPQHAS